MSKQKTFLYSLLAFLILAVPTLIALYTDFLWFSAQNLSSVYFTTISYQIATFAIAAVVSYAALHITLLFTEKNIKKAKKYARNPITLPALGFLSLLIAVAYSSQWETLLRYANSYAFSTTEPIFNNNIAKF